MTDRMLTQAAPTGETSYSWHPWARFNLHRNPFGELSRDERAQLAILDSQETRAGILAQGEAFQFVGECGRGKTTRLLAILGRYPSASYVYLPEGEACPPIPSGNPLMIDEAQRLPRRVRRYILQSRVPLVLATHVDLCRTLRRYGYRVQSRQIGPANTPELVARLLNRRIEASRLGCGEVTYVAIDQARSLVERYGSDVRAIEHDLYERLQRQVCEDGEMRFVD